MPYILSNMLAVAARVLTQLRHDRRFLILALMLPAVTVYMLYLFFEGVDAPIFDPEKFIMPVGAFMVHFITYALCAIALVRERTAQTLGRMFVNGYRQVEIIGGYVLAYTLLATVQSLIVLIGLSLLFKLDYSTGTFVALYLTIWLLAIISIAMGILVSNFARNEGQVFPFIPLVIFLSVLFSGMILPTEKLPEWSRPASLITPMYYANLVVQALIKPNGTLGDTWGLAGLIAYGIAIFSLATFTLRELE